MTSVPAASARRHSVPVSPARDAAPIRLGAIVLTFAAAYTLFGVLRHRDFASSAYDLGIFDQAVWHLSRFEAPASTISGFSNILGDHFYPVIALFAPLYWIAPRPETLIVAQAVLLASSMFPVHAFLRRRLTPGVAVSLTAAYAFSWGIQQTAAFDVHEMAFAPLLVASVILAMDTRRWTLFWVSAASLMLVKEDLLPFLTGVGAYLFATGERRRGATLCVGSLVAFALVTMVVIPAFADSGAYAYTGAFLAVIERPWTIPLVLVTPFVKVRTAFLWFAPFLFLSLASPLSALVIPIALERFLSASPLHWGTVFHYSAPIAPIIAMSAGDGIARVRQRFGRRGTTAIAGVDVALAINYVAGACLIVAAILPGRLPLARLTYPHQYRGIGTADAAAMAVSMVPPRASVVAQSPIVPHLSQRQQIFMLQPGAPDADIVIASTALDPWPMADAAAVRALVDERTRLGYRVIFNRDGWYVLSRASTAPSQ